MAVTRTPRPIHRYGITYHANFRSAAVHPALEETAVFRADAPRPALLRMSQAFTVRAPIDYVGLAIKLPDAYGAGRDQDFILISSPGAPVWRRFPLPSANALAATYSSGTTFRVGGEQLLFGASFYPLARAPLDSMTALASHVGAALHFLVAAPHGPWQLAARIEVGTRSTMCDSDIRFNPASDGGGIEAVGMVNAARNVIYRYFQDRASLMRLPRI